MNLKIFSQGISLIEKATGKTFGKQQLEVYKSLLNDISDERFIEGINTLLRERVYSNLPQPAEIREYCLGLKIDDLALRIANVKNLLKKGISKAGIYNDLVFEDPTIHILIKMYGGWIKICKSDIDELEKWLTFEMPKLYKAVNIRKVDNFEEVIKGIGEFKEVYQIGSAEKINKWQISYKNKIEQIEKN